MNIETQIDELSATLALVKTGLSGSIGEFADRTAKALLNGKRIFLMGNGGSAADAQHIAAEFVGRYKASRTGLPAFALTTNSSTLTAIANDFSYEELFSRQVEALAGEGDIVVGITTSGNSANIIRAMEAAKLKGCFVVALLGGDGGKAKALADLAIVVPSRNTPRIQECHILIGHIVCELAENALLQKN